MGLIESGLMRTFIMQEGVERTFGFISEKGFLTNYESFVNQRPSSSSIQALEDTTVHVATFENFEHIYQHTRSGDRIGRLVLGRVFIKLQNELTSFYTDSPIQRYQNFITTYPNLQQRMSQYHIASFVGVKPPSLSRIRRRILSQ
jgi:CRP-like cAMP-binding protein